ncbi:MAG: hypothetical protein HC929_19750 [Leptolyngbyaceae cyanobacterium SM2_5_2]|nr:hypothetical protein [Leptolyngbyaceae cyanobacterium SM2_5_2]
MAYVSASTARAGEGSFGSGNISRIVGLVCVVGFLFDMLVLFLPPELGNVEWRIGFMQAFANRSVILLFGIALLIYGSVGNSRSRLKVVSQFSMVLGLVFFLLSLLSIVDSIQLNQRAVSAISSQETQLQTQIRDAQTNPGSLPENINPDQLQEFSQQLTAQADTLKRNAKRTVLKTGISNIGNLLLVGAGLVGLGRSGMALSRSRG